MGDETRLGNLEVLDEVNPYWYKLAAFLMRRLLEAEGKPMREAVVFSWRDIAAFADMFGAEAQHDESLMPTIVYHPEGETITLRLLPMREAEELARKPKR